ncbi:uncharacterized protein [Branchiostoma lanceolatum]|uniref:uncharacterized protein n=1 Tax=Branchiostoma lanceolatum TaxID=7740 RepID=UPI001133027A
MADEMVFHSDSSESSVDAFFEVADSDEPAELEGAVGGIVPYRYEPYLDDMQAEEPDDNDEGTEEDRGNGNDGDIQRLQNTEWCSCGRCEAMPTVVESVCCREQARVSATRDELDGLRCITEHPGFEPVCLNVYVLTTAHSGYRQQYGVTLGNEWKRYSAYRQFVTWCYDHLGKEVRVPLPSCAVSTIRRAFPSADYTGYKEN